MSLPKEPSFEADEYRRRVSRVQQQMAEENVDLLLCTTLANVCYLTGIESIAPHKYWLVGLALHGDPILLCEEFESHNASLSSWVDDVQTYDKAADPVAATADLVRRLNLDRARIGTERNTLSSLSVQHFLKLRDLLPKAEPVDATGCIPGVMAIKSEPEIACLRRAGAITRAAMEAAMESAPDAETDNEIAAAAYERMMALGSEFSAYPIVVTSGRRSSIPHSTFKRNKLDAGDPVFMEIGACIHRYHAPMMRTAFQGRPSDRAREMIRTCRDSVELLLDNIREGVIAGDVAALSEARVRKLDAPVVWHGFYGYSVGLGFPPTWADRRDLIIRTGSDDVLKAGMVFHVNTSLRDVGRYGTAFSETVLVTKDGCEVLTVSAPDRLLE